MRYESMRLGKMRFYLYTELFKIIVHEVQFHDAAQAFTFSSEGAKTKMKEKMNEFYFKYRF